MNSAKSQDTKSIHRNHLHSNILTTKKSEKEIKESILFTIATKRIKYLGINLCKETKELYTENYKVLMKEIKDDINRYAMFLGRKIQYCENDYSLRLLIFLPAVLIPAYASSSPAFLRFYRFSVIPIILPMAFFTELE